MEYLVNHPVIIVYMYTVLYEFIMSQYIITIIICNIGRPGVILNMFRNRNLKKEVNSIDVTRIRIVYCKYR